MKPSCCSHCGAKERLFFADDDAGAHDILAADGDIDICSKPWGVISGNGNGGRMHVDFLENQLRTPHPKP